ncbi:MAG: hypothetical protein PVJ33_13400 [Lysobacterales bacterium]|jgi:hypothetical protein
MSDGHLPRDDADKACQWAFNEVALRAEVLFWRELIETSGPAQPRESVERMQQALALAELKLRKAYETRRRTIAASGGGADETASPLRDEGAPAAKH